MEAGMDKAMAYNPAQPLKEPSYQRLVDLQNTTRETMGVLIDRLRPVLVQHPEEARFDSPPVLHASGMAERVAVEEQILGMLKQVLNDLDL